jgi:hypothetical protein
MSRGSLGVIALVLILLMVIVATAGLDNLPRSLHASVAAAGARLSASRAAYDRDRRFVDQEVRAEPDLFKTRAAAWNAQLDKDKSQFAAAAAALASLQKIAKANHRKDSDQVARGLADFKRLCQQPVDDAVKIRAEVQRWLTYKQQLPQREDVMRASYETVKAFDLAAATPAVAKAMADWPAKRSDLQSRLDALKKTQADGEQIWDSAAPLRAAIDQKHLAGFDYATFFSDGDRLDNDANQLRTGAATLNTLAGQLYTSWDRIVENVDSHDGYQEKIRTVITRYPDSTLTNGNVTTQEQWMNVDQAQYSVAEHAVGMAIAHKPAGEYDSEVQNVVRPAEYAYIAPPGQANHYGSWVGGVWQWLPAYLLLRGVLHTPSTAVTVGDYNAYRQARQSGSIFYGRNDEFRPHLAGGWTSHGSSHPYGSAGSGWYHERPKPSFGGGFFESSKYRSRGGFATSKYRSRGSFSGFGHSYSRGMGGFRGFRGRR